MQTSLATRTKSPDSAEADSGLLVRVARLVCICAKGADRGSPPSSRRRQRSSALHLDGSSLAPPKEISRNGIKPFLLIWSEWRDSNSRHPGPKPGALPTGPHPDSIRTGFIIHDSLQKINQIFSEKPPELDFRGTILRKAVQIAQHIQYIITNLLRCFRRILLELSRNRCA